MKVATTVCVLLLAACLLMSDIDAKKKKRRFRKRKFKKGRLPPPVVPKVPHGPAACGPIPHVEYGQGLGTTGQVTYACQPGYKLQGTNVITCLDGRWTVAPSCIREVCHQPPNAAYSHPAKLSGDGKSATYTCLPGYVIQNGNGLTQMTIQCFPESRTWPNPPVCQSATHSSCVSPPVIANAMSQVSGKTATYTCKAGYKLLSGTPSTITCTHGTWPTHHLPVCVVDNKQPPPGQCTAPPCGDAKLMKPVTGDFYSIGSKVTYTCVVGYKIAGQNDNTQNSVEIKCLNDGSWEKLPMCEKVDCGVPPIGVNTKSVTTSMTKYLDTYTYSCIDNYMSGMALTTTCQADGNWSNPPPTCNPKTCPYSALPTLTNGKPYSKVEGSDSVVGETVVYTCNEGYRVAPGTPGSLFSSQKISCLANGTFTALEKTCVYQYPSSCRDYYTRDGITPTSTSVEVIIDMDGSGGTYSTTMVKCKGSVTPDEVCTLVSPTTTTYNPASAGAVSLSSGTTGVVFPTDTTGPADGIYCGNVQAIGYSPNSNQILKIIGDNENCHQKITISCVAAVDLFAVVYRNGLSNARGYSIEALARQAVSGLASDVCDCFGAATSCNTGCTCSSTAATTGSDMITHPLTSTYPNYVTSVNICGEEATDADNDIDLSLNEYSITVGDIECCESQS